MLKLEREGKNRVWVAIISNAFAPILHDEGRRIVVFKVFDGVSKCIIKRMRSLDNLRRLAGPTMSAGFTFALHAGKATTRQTDALNAGRLRGKRAGKTGINQGLTLI